MGTTRSYRTLDRLVVTTKRQPHALEEAEIVGITGDENVVIEQGLFLLPRKE